MTSYERSLSPDRSLERKKRVVGTAPLPLETNRIGEVASQMQSASPASTPYKRALTFQISNEPIVEDDIYDSPMSAPGRHQPSSKFSIVLEPVETFT